MKGFCQLVVDELGPALRAAGITELVARSDQPPSVMWHADAGSGQRPCPASPVW